ncbi:hypothetical protein [Paraburkholderia sp.]|uniref:hypothetical protein n=1 Tax=Paraburkholderia sp. TaxID=1926495 RepID=UPI00238AABC9|nr:hypothetical protein [Paraburkholderia sp.]MDE1181937.1 hypothetical protein [Paraburkholderia sp.]
MATMTGDDDERSRRAMRDEAIALQHSVAAIRKAQGKLNPSDCEAGTDEFERTVDDYVEDLVNAMFRTVRDGWRDRNP